MTKLRFVQPCRWAKEVTQLPQGSRYRLERMKRGRHPDAFAPVWPDGTNAKQKVRMQAVKSTKMQEEQMPVQEENVEDDTSEEERLDYAAAWHQERKGGAHERTRAGLEEITEEDHKRMQEILLSIS